MRIRIAMEPELGVSGAELREAVLTSLARFGGGIRSVSLWLRPARDSGFSARIAVRAETLSLEHEHFGRSVQDAALSALSRAARTLERRARLGETAEDASTETESRQILARVSRRAGRRGAR